MTTSILSSRSACVTWLRPSRTARSAASLTMFASSAPEAPEAIRAIFEKSTPGSSLIFFAWTRRIASRPFRSGSSTGTRRSNRPGRVSAGSSDSGRLVAARMTTPVFSSNPSISVRSWLSVCSRSSLLLRRPSRFWPIASISSIKTIQGRLFFCLLKKVTHLGSTHTDKHLDKFRTGHRKKWDVRLTGNRLGQHGFTGTGRADAAGYLWALPRRSPCIFRGYAGNRQSRTGFPSLHPHPQHPKI